MVAQDREGPSFEVRALLEACSAAPGAQEGVLYEVVGRYRLAGERDSEAAQSRHDSDEQPLKLGIGATARFAESRIEFGQQFGKAVVALSSASSCA